MKQCPGKSSECHTTTEEELYSQEFRAWGHDFNAAGMFANNQGQADDLLWDKLRCPAGVTGLLRSLQTTAAISVWPNRSPKPANSKGK